MSAQLRGASPEEIRDAAQRFAGIVLVLEEQLCNGGEPDFPEVKVLVWRAEKALRELKEALSWRLEVRA